MNYLDNDLDSSTANTKYFKRAKIIFGCLCLTLLLSIVITMVTSSLTIEEDIRDLWIGIPILITIFLSPFALYAIVKSYVRKEEVENHRLLYLLGIVLVNIVFLLFIIAIINDIT